MRLAGGTQTSSGKSEGDVVVVSKDRIELSALKPLWQLYTNLIKTYGELCVCGCVCVCVCVDL